MHNGKPERVTLASEISEAFSDITNGARGWPLWTTLAHYDLVQRFRRSALGPLWITLSLAVMTAILGVTYSRVLGIAIVAYLPYLAVGLIVWNFASITLQEASDCFVQEAGVLWQTYIPRSACLFRVVWRNFIILVLNSTLLAIIFPLCGISLRWHMALAIPGAALLCVNILWIGFLLAILCTRFRDVSRIVALAMQLALLVTPIIWRVGKIDGLGILVQWNPLYHGIELVRAPLLVGGPAFITWVVAGATAAFGTMLAFSLFAIFRSRIIYWL